MLSVPRVDSYLEITKVIKFLKFITEDVDKTFLELVACNAGGIEYNTLNKHLSNRHLQDALELDNMISSKVIEEMESSFNPRSIDAICLQLMILQDKALGADGPNPFVNFKDCIDHLTDLTIGFLRQQELIKTDNKIITQEHLDQFDKKGYIVVPSALDEDQTNALLDLTLRYAHAEEEAQVAYKYGENNTLQRVYNLISKHSLYADLLENRVLREILDSVFTTNTLHQKYVMSSYQANLVGPGAISQKIHVDSSVPNPLPEWLVRVNTAFPLTDFTEENGATLVLPGSHKFCRIPKEEDVADQELIPVIAPKGSMICWNGHLWHKSGANRTDDVRIALFPCFAASYLKEVSTEEEHLRIVDEDVMNYLTSEVRFMIGLDRGIKAGAYYRLEKE